MKFHNAPILALITMFFLISSCTSIPKVQNGNGISKIFSNQIELENGKILKTVPKDDAEKTTLILVRHAEKAKDQKDPNLTPAGVKRAQKLSKMLQSIPLDEVFSSPYNRTLETAQPTAESQSLTVKEYDPRALVDFGKSVLKNYSGKHILIVGHSNTTPTLLNFFLEEKVVESIDESDYGNVYIINVFSDKENKAVLGRF